VTLQLDLTFASKEDSLTVRTFTVNEELSGLFEVNIVARSPNDEIDLASIVGKGAVLRVKGDGLTTPATVRIWNGICSQMTLIQAEATGLSTYAIRIVPAFWRTTLRRNNRIFQHKTIPEIVQAVCEDWKIKPELKLQATYPTYEYKVQYNETDHDFISRLLEEAGITYFFAYGDGKTADEQTHLVLADEPQKAAGRGPVTYVVDTTTKTSVQEWVSQVKLTQRMTPGHFAIRDYDFRTKPDYQLIQEAKAPSADNEDKYEQYHYTPGAFLVEPGKKSDTPVADDKGTARVDEKFGKDLATKSLDAVRRGTLQVDLKTVANDLWPGQVFSIKDHPRSGLSPDHKLLVIHSVHQGGDGAKWDISVDAVFCDVAYRPTKKTPKPRVVGVQSAMVVGPAGVEIHTDEFGRVRVQFHWDREGKFNDFSSCWIRVSQAWAGFGYGTIMIPRVGHEVLVDFFDGDPDQPVVVGRVFNNTTRVPYKLPDNMTKSGWKSDTSPGSNGFNEISLEDAKSREVIHIQAQKDFTEIVKNNQSSTVLNSRSASVTVNDSVVIGKNQSTDIDENHLVSVGDSQISNIMKTRYGVIGETDAIEIGRIYSVNVGSGNGMIVDGKSRTIVLTTGKATIVLGPDTISLNAMGSIEISAGGLLKLSGQEVQIDGGPNVYVNTKGAKGPAVVPFEKVKDPKEPAKPGSGGEVSKAAPLLSGQGTIEKPLGFEDVAAPPPTPAAAPAKITSALTKAITEEVAKADPAASVKKATNALLSKDNLKKAAEIAKAIKDAKSTKGMSLLGVSEIKDAVANIVTQPIIGKLSGVDVADMLNQAQAFGIVHLSKDALAGTAFIRGAAPDAENKTKGFLGDLVSKPLIGDFSISDVAGVAKEGAAAGLFKVGAKDSNILDQIGGLTPEGKTNKLAELIGAKVTTPITGDVSLKDIADTLKTLSDNKVTKLGKDGTKAVDAIQAFAKDAPKPPDPPTPPATPEGAKPEDAKPQALLMMKTGESPAKIDGQKIDAYAAALQQGGMPQHDAMLKAMGDQGIVTYFGESDGSFTKIA
jgi:type VI secretion system secreted protein VgrG